jgi:hypothetical protein
MQFAGKLLCQWTNPRTDPIKQGIARAWERDPRDREGAIMFEVPEEKEEASRATLWIGVAVVLVLAVVGVFIYVTSKGGAKSTAPAATSAATAGITKADPVHDLRVVSAKMDKDYTGTTAMWSVEIKNGSSEYTYSNIAYETTYAAADNSILLTNQGKVAVSIGPDEDQTAEFRDALYPPHTAWYKVRITGATAARQ